MDDWADRESALTELPDYPAEWTAEQRVAAYWHALYHTGMPANTRGWETVLSIAGREAERRRTATTPTGDPK